MRGWMVAVFAVLAACKGGGDDTVPIIADSGGGDDCGSTPPVIEALTIEDGGMSEGDACGAEIRPRVKISADMHDDDGDLSYWEMRVWWDEAIDASVDTSGAPQTVHGTVGEECSVHDLTASMLLCVNGSGVPFDTDLEFGVVILDYHEHDSGPAELGSYHTPAE